MASHALEGGPMRSARRDYAAALKRYAEMTAEPCQRPCCANREWLLADLEAVS